MKAPSLLRALTRASVVVASAALAPPTTLLGGFLGAGKTTALANMLKNREGLKIAVLVNDVASVNVDAQILRRSTVDESGVEMVELENGCVCCGPGAGGLAPAVRQLASRVDESTGKCAFDHVVVELSGVADPTNVQKNLNGGGVDVDHKVALVDGNAFPSMYNSVQEMGERTDLAGADQLELDPCSVDRRVVELLLVQIETADVILVNKADLASPQELETTLTACRALNPGAQIRQTTFGDADLDQILPLDLLLATSGTDGAETDAATREHSHASECAEPACTDPSHDHSHANEHSHDSGCTEPDCTDASHSHSHDSGCTEPGCTDTSHEHSHDDAVPNSAESLGFQTFVYRARRPFVQSKLFELVKMWPLPSKEVLTSDGLAAPGAEALAKMEAAGRADGSSATFANVLRSKGTCWLDQQHRVQAAWSHAGRHFRLTPSGNWWATLPDPIVRACLASDGADITADSPAYRVESAHYEGEWGDRRQELVFIGVGLDEAKISTALDACLASDDELMMYRAIWQVDEERLRAENGPFRFGVGARVECAMSEDTWARGTVVQQYFREPHWSSDRWMPYKVLLDGDDDADYIWAPADLNECIRAAK